MRTSIAHLYSDIWRHIFEYFNALELLFSLVHITEAADDVLFNEGYHLRLRGLIIDDSIRALPKELLLSQVISLELHQKGCFERSEHCSELRSLKVIGQSEWTISLLKKVSHTNVKLEQLVLVVPGVGPLYDLLECITPLISLRRLSIVADQSDEKIKPHVLPMIQTNIKRFSLHSCSSINWNELSHMLPFLSNVCFLDITISHDNKDSVSWFSFPKVSYMSLRILEVPFECLSAIIKTVPSLVKLKLSGLVNIEGFVVNHRWLDLFDFCPSLNIVTVNLSMERDTSFFPIDTVQTSLREVNLNLSCMDDDCDYYSDTRYQHRWWTLSGIISR
ncbi:unnamed protein product [Adineta ricciae]|uniref:Uncharacterized protein n=1 Tax=Adineta ricciae TaxID=249248 RepID=A0A814WJF7_ADIRI|nr:unnamed protein product [Adineta ricciae]CAF1393418.1 unnamed protein product [Adineta ricciae]